MTGSNMSSSPGFAWLLDAEPRPDGIRDRLLAHIVRAFRGDPYFSAHACRRVRDGVSHAVPDIVVRRKRDTVHLFRIAGPDRPTGEEAWRSWLPVAAEAAALNATAWIVLPAQHAAPAARLLAQEGIVARIAPSFADAVGGIRIEWPPPDETVVTLSAAK
jgi:hypothetical protein